MTAYTLPSGGTSTSSGIILNNGDTLTVNSGGTAVSATVNSGGTAFVSAGGAMDSTSVNSSGFVYVSSGGVTTGTILSGLPNFVTQVFSSGTEVVYTGGSAINTTAFQAGKQIISGGMALDTTVTNGGEEDVLARGTTTGTIAISGGSEQVSSGGSAVSVTVSTGGFEYVSSGGTASFTTVSSGGIAETEFGGSAISATVDFGGNFTDGGSATATTVTEGNVTVEGHATDTIVNAASITVDNGATTGTMLNGFGNLSALEVVVSGGVASDTTVNSAGYQLIGTLFGGGTAIGTMVDSFGFQYVSTGGTASNTQVNYGGEQVVSSGGTAIGTSVNSVGAEVVTVSGVASGTIVNSSGVQYVYSGASATDTAVNGGGFEDAYGTVTSTTVNSGGVEAVYSGSTVSDTLVESGGAIDLEALTFSSGGSVSLSATDVLTVSVGGQVYTQQLSGNYTGEYFHLSDGTSVGKVGYGGTLVTLNDTPCYCRGTRILIDSGERAVEQLSIGDKVVTKSGALRSIRWIGRRSYSGHYAASNPEVLPVLIKQGALADEVPRRDLWVSPLHAMFLEGMLVPAAALVNGISIVRAESVQQLDYFHLELDTHDVIYAEGALAESFIDDDSRTMFHNAAQYQSLYPQAVHEPARYCAPRVEEGEQLEALRARLLERTRPAGSRAQTGRLLGQVDAVSRERIEGWAQDEAAPDEPVSLRVLDHGIVIGQVLADRYREDLQQAGIGDGRHGFSLMVAGGLSPLVPHLIRIQRVCDGQPLQPARATV